MARTVTGFDPGAPTPDWMARRLAQCGMRPISLGVDVTNYVMLEIGQPIHGYDRDKLRRADPGPAGRRGREGSPPSTAPSATLSTEDLLITDDSGPIGLAGVMGGETTELSETTTDIVVEAAHWDPVSIFRTERRHKLPSEASKRFERGVDPELPAGRGRPGRRAAGRATAAARSRPGVTVVGEPPRRDVPSPPTADLPARITGMDIPGETAVAAPRGRRLRRSTSTATG